LCLHFLKASLPLDLIPKNKSMIEIETILLGVENLIKEYLDEIISMRFSISYKEDNSPVTEADKRLENLIGDYLHSKILKLTFIGEESFDFNIISAKDYVAVLDPIDGTENFCSGLKEWGVSLGIWHHGKHQGSLLMLPELNETMITGQKIQKIQSRITGFSSSFNEEIVEGIRNSVEYRVTGCAVYNLFNVIRGSFTRFVNPKGAYVWDLLPGVMLALEHNCDVLLNDEPFDGQNFLDPTKKYRVDIRNSDF